MKKLISLFVMFLMVFNAIQVLGQNFVQVSRQNAGETISLTSGQVLEVNLPRKASNGYCWCVAKTPEGKTTLQSIAQIGEDDFIHNPNPLTIDGRIIAGQDGTQLMRFVGTSAGLSELTLELRRPWEKNRAAVDTYSVKVISQGKYNGSYSAPVKEKPVHTTSTPKDLPSKWDWRPYCTPIADQQQCGDCWAFAGVGTLECNISIIDGVTRDISEAYVTNCDVTQGLGCNGGLCPHSMWMAPQGAVYESDYPWTSALGSGTSGTCGGPFTYHETIDSYANVPGQNMLFIPPDANIKSAIYNYGPVWVDVCAASTAWDNYPGGIFTESGVVFDHCVVLVGWCDSTSVPGGGYWILRNSWGADWGMHGYMYISYGSDVVGMFANYIVYKGGTSQFLSTKQVTGDNNIHIYPVPAGNNITIESNQPSLIEIYDNQGKLIKHLSEGNLKTQVDISDLARGLYFMKVKTEKGLAIKKFVKE